MIVWSFYALHHPANAATFWIFAVPLAGALLWVLWLFLSGKLSVDDEVLSKADAQPVGDTDII